MTQFTAGNSSLIAEPTGAYVDTNALRSVTIMGLQTTPVEVMINGRKLDSAHWLGTKQSLILTELDEEFTQGAWRTNWNITWS